MQDALLSFLSGAFVIAGSQSRPSTQKLGSGERREIRTDFCQDSIGRREIDARDRIQ